MNIEITKHALSRWIERCKRGKPTEARLLGLVSKATEIDGRVYMPIFRKPLNNEVFLLNKQYVFVAIKRKDSLTIVTVLKSKTKKRWR